MKITSLLLLILLSLLNYSEKKEAEINYVIFSGKVENRSIDSLKLYNKDYKPVKTIYLAKDSTFLDTLFIPIGYYHLDDWNSSKMLFLKPKYDLSIIIRYNEEEFDLSFKGIGRDENNYLSKKIKFDKKFKKVNDYNYYLNLDEERFLTLADSIKLQKRKFLQKFTNVDPDFLECEFFSIAFENATYKQRYKNWRGEFLKNDNFKVSSNFPNPYETIDISNEKLLAHPSYLSSIEEKLHYESDNQVGKPLLQYLNTIEKKINSPLVVEELAYSRTKFIIQGNNKISNAEYSKFMLLVKNEKYRNEIDDAYQKAQKVAIGTISPSFEFYDINNKLTTLESLKGKLVYIDVWATWCIPCIDEMPALKQIQEEFMNKDIYFVSMCLKDTKENFEIFVKENKLGGIQLFAPDPDDLFFKGYFLTTIPRFILIDQEGKIIDAYAYKPSNPKLKELLLEYL